MKTVLTIEYDNDNPTDKDEVQRMLFAGEAWGALFEIKELIYKETKEDIMSKVGLADTIIEIINETSLERVYH